MGSITDDRGYNQMFTPSIAMKIRMERRCDYILKQMSNITEQTHILEIGSGTGEMAASLALKTKAQVTGSDICAPFMDEAKQKHIASNLNFIILDFNHTESIQNKQFDYIVGNGILHHLYNNLDSALINIKRLLKPNGQIIFLEPNLYNPYCFLIFNTTKRIRNWAKLEPDEMALRKNKIKKQLKHAKYSNIKIK